MTMRSAIACAMLLALTTNAWSAEKPKKAVKVVKTAKAAAKAAPKKPPKAVARITVRADKTAARSATSALVARTTRTHATVVKTAIRPPASPVLHGPREILTCRDGTEDRHARIAVVLVGGKTESFAYYSKWKPRTCSIYLQRNRDASRWSDSGSVTNVNAEKGVFMIEHGKGEYRFVFRDVDRERYCGMDGRINGTLTIRKGSEQCEVAGIMEEGVPLGQAVAYAEAAEAANASSPTPAEPASPVVTAAARAAPRGETSFFKRLAQSFKHEPSSTWNGGVIIGD
jgi:hypothetical protein